MGTRQCRKFWFWDYSALMLGILVMVGIDEYLHVDVKAWFSRLTECQLWIAGQKHCSHHARHQREHYRNHHWHHHWNILASTTRLIIELIIDFIIELIIESAGPLGPRMFKAFATSGNPNRINEVVFGPPLHLPKSACIASQPCVGMDVL